MGAPLSMYGLLQRMKANDRRLHLPFQLYVLVLYDNKKHPSIARDIEQNLREYHKMTGEYVLFFVPFEDFPADLTSGLGQWLTPEAWGEQYPAILNPYRSDQYNPDQEPSFSVSRLAQELEISNQLPCIVVSEDIFRQVYFVVPLSENEMTYTNVGDVLRDMKNNARDIQDGYMNFVRMRRNNQQYRTLIASKRFLDVWQQAYVQRNPSDAVQKLNRLMEAYKQLQHEYAELARMNAELTDEHDLELYTYHDKQIQSGKEIWDLLHDTKRRLERQRPDLANARQVLNQPWEALEPVSLKYWRTANEIIQAIEMLHISDDITYAPLIAVLCQLIELEWNYSFVHVIRAALGIQLPQSFAKCDFDNLTSGIIRSGAKTINFNKQDRRQGIDTDKWIPPGMGESRIVFDTAFNNPAHFNPDLYVDEHLKHVFIRNVNVQLRDLLNLMEQITNYRNDASHGGRVLDSRDFVDVCHLINRLGKYMSLFIELKVHYRGDTYQDIIDKMTNHHALVRAFNHASDYDQIAILEYAWQSKKSLWHAFVLACLPTNECDLFLHTDADFIRTHHSLIMQIHGVITITCDRAAVRQIIQADIAKVLGTNIVTYVSFSAQLSSWDDVAFWFAPLLASSSAQACEFVIAMIPRFDTAEFHRAFGQLPAQLQINVLWTWPILHDDATSLVSFFLLLSDESKDDVQDKSWLTRDKRWIAYVASVMSPVDYEFLYSVFDVPEHERATVENAVVHLQEMAIQDSTSLGTPRTRSQLVEMLIRHMSWASSTDYLDAVFSKLTADEQAAVLARAHELMQVEISGKWRRFWQAYTT